MKKILKENIFFVFIGVAMSIYYLYRLFMITPWYDEVYTYLSFIDKGFFYSITHWPLPNNHILFSALSTLLRPAGVYIALRGVSYISAMGTLVVIYIFMKHIFGKGIATVGVMLYTVLNSVNTLAIQGRGYSFATFCFALSIYFVYQIIWSSEKTIKYYFLFSLSLFMGLYTLVSSVYWVMAICICGGLLLLIQKRNREFLKLIVFALLAAVMTFFAYSIVWMAIGSNNIIDNWIGYEHESHVSMILHRPFLCLVEGFKLMANNPYMQGIENRSVFLRDFIYFGRNILNSFFDVQSNLLCYIFVGVVIYLAVLYGFRAVRQFTDKQNKDIKSIDMVVVLSGVGVLVMFLVLFVQCAYPFERVFSFMGIILVIQAGLFLYWLQCLCDKFYKKFLVSKIICGMVIVVCALMLLSPAYNREYSSLDYSAHDAIKQIEWEGADSYMTNDIFAKQQVEYHCIIGKDMKLQEDRENPSIIFIKKNIQLEAWGNLPFDEEFYELNKRPVLYENSEYIIFGE